MGEEFEYLGIAFTSKGKTKLSVLAQLERELQILIKPPYKPQQRLYALRSHLLPRIYHYLALGCLVVGHLKRADILVRKKDKKCLDRPHDVPVTYIHATVQDGGLGIPSLKWLIARLRLSRLET